jgi:hypothetical protein
MKDFFYDKAGAKIYPNNPEKHELLNVSNLIPNIIEVYGFGICRTGDVLVTIDKHGDKIAMRLPKSENISIWAILMFDIIKNESFENQFPCKLKLEFDSDLNDYVATFLFDE